NAAIDAPFGVPLVNYGVCQGGETAGALTPTRTALRAAGFDYTADINPATGNTVADALDPTGRVTNGTGNATNIKGTRLPQVPNGQIGVGGQYTMHFDQYTLVPRVDYYWQSSMEARVNNDPGSDYIAAWDTMN